MPALPARRIASGAACAALLVGITGPAAAAAAAGPAAARTHAARPDTRLPGADALLAKVRELGAHRKEVTPVTRLLTAVLEADRGHLPAAEARKLGDDAKRALSRLPATARAKGVLPPAAGRGAAAAGALGRLAADPTDDALEALGKAVDELVQAITADAAAQVSSATADAAAQISSGTAGTTGEVSSVTVLINDMIDLLTTTLLGGVLPAVTPSESATDPASDPASDSASTAVSSEQVVTLPDTPLPEIPLPAETLPAPEPTPAS
ncbi:hypothetical protein [Streptomyces sp. NPDC004065]|uniref:hypothetical protein n=1 Tax=Streptomyces sp. NPDC004065 TaxID=3364689 RepID=UPI00384DC9C1